MDFLIVHGRNTIFGKLAVYTEDLETAFDICSIKESLNLGPIDIGLTVCRDLIRGDNTCIDRW